MKTLHKVERYVLLVGDVFFLYVSLYIKLLLRYAKFPDTDILGYHLLPFSILFVFWVISFFIAGLYEKHTTILKNKLPQIILNTEIINSVVAVLFFYFIPYLTITPKASLFIFLIVSLVFIFVWRLWLFERVFSRWNNEKKSNAILVATGDEMKELEHEINSNNRYSIKFVRTIDVSVHSAEGLRHELAESIAKEGVSVVVLDLKNEKVKPAAEYLYSLIFSKIEFIDVAKLYENIFEREPLSLLHHYWFLENISTSPKAVHDLFKRILDITLSIIGGAISLLFYPFVYIAIKLDDGGPIFIEQERIGKSGKLIKMIKFRSMRKRDSDKGIWLKENDTRVTRVGKFLRKSRIDELPQIWSVLKGDLSLIGPRPDIYNLGKELEAAIPYYSIRSVISPGLSGWAQVSQDLPPQSLEATKIRLAYDLYYVKNRSVILDIRIVLRTIRTLLSRSGM